MRVLAMIVVALGSLDARAAGYEMADLEALDKQGSYDELVQHLGDIAPSKRDKKWMELAERGAIAWLGGMKVTDENPDLPLNGAESLLKRFPQLKQSKPLMQKRAETGLKSFQYNYGKSRHSRSEDPWLDNLTEFVKNDGGATPDLPYKAARLVTSRLVADTAWPLYKLAFDKSGAALCKDADFQKTLLATVSSGSWLKESATVIKEKCWAEMQPLILAALPKDFDMRDHACPILKEKKIERPECQPR